MIDNKKHVQIIHLKSLTNVSTNEWKIKNEMKIKRQMCGVKSLAFGFPAIADHLDVPLSQHEGGRAVGRGRGISKTRNIMYVNRE